MRFYIFFITTLVAAVMAAPTPAPAPIKAREGASSKDVGCAVIKRAGELNLRCVGIEVSDLNNNQSNFDEPLLIFSVGRI